MEALIVYPTKEQEKAVKAFLKALDVQFEKKKEVLPAHVLAGIKRGQEDFEKGNTISFEEFKQQLSISKWVMKLPFHPRQTKPINQSDHKY